jgi:hypothetical protein
LPRISDTKTKEGVFVGPQIRELIQDVKREDQLSEVEKPAWKSLKNVTTNSSSSSSSSSYSFSFFSVCWNIIRQKTIVIWQQILYNPTKP